MCNHDPRKKTLKIKEVALTYYFLKSKLGLLFLQNENQVLHSLLSVSPNSSKLVATDTFHD